MKRKVYIFQDIPEEFEAALKGPSLVSASTNLLISIGYPLPDSNTNTWHVSQN